MLPNSLQQNPRNVLLIQFTFLGKKLRKRDDIEQNKDIEIEKEKKKTKNKNKRKRRSSTEAETKLTNETTNLAKDNETEDFSNLKHSDDSSDEEVFIFYTFLYYA